MYRKLFLLFILVVFALEMSAQNKPNVVFILADDLGAGDISYMNKEAEWFRHTPNIDRICEQGIYFRNFSVHHVCSPTRAGLLSGLHYTKVGSGSETGGTLDNSIPNVAKDFQANGYVTGAFGKWHNGYPNAPAEGNWVEVNKVSEIDSSNNTWEKKADKAWGEGVNAYGFDKWTGYHSGGGDYFNRYVNAHKEKDWWIDQNWRPHTSGYTTDLIGEAAISFIENNKDSSFFCYVPMECVHAPYHAKLSDLQELCKHFPGEWEYVKDLVSPTTGRKVSESPQLKCSPGNEFDYTAIVEPDSGRFIRLIYATMVYSMDKAVGEILSKLEEHGLSEHTIVFFSSDNGATLQGSNGIFQGSKHTLWEGGIHVPTAMYWPGTIDANSLTAYSPGDNIYDGYVQFLDFYPTIMSLTNSTISATQLDGLDFSDGLINRYDVRQEYEKPYFGINTQWGVVKTGKWKLHYNEVLPGQILQLYDLDTDPGETTNLTYAEPGITNDLKELYNNWVNENNYAFSYLPLPMAKIPESEPNPAGNILEVKAWQDDSITEPFGIRFSNFSLGGEHAGDWVQFDMYIPDDSDCDSGFHFSPGGGPRPYYIGYRAVTQDSINLNTMKWPRNQWIRTAVGYGNHAPIGGYANYVYLHGTDSGYTHFYLDNMILHKSDGSAHTIWKDEGDFDAVRYRYYDVQYKTLDEVKVIEDFPFSDVQLKAAPVNVAAFHIKNLIEDVILEDESLVLSLDDVFEVIGNPSAGIGITIKNWTNKELLDVYYDNQTKELLLARKGELGGESHISISGVYQGKELSISFHVEIIKQVSYSNSGHVAGQFRIYPNPASHSLFIESRYENFTMQLYNTLGELILTKENQEHINVSGIKPGIYILELGSGNSTVREKLLIH